MIGRIIGFAAGRLMRKQRLDIELEDDFTGLYDELKDKRLVIDIKEYSPGRSKNANKYFWELCGRLAAKLRQPKEQIYRFYVRDIGDNYNVITMDTGAVKEFDRIWQTGDGGKPRIGWFTEEMPSSEKGKSDVVAYYGSSAFNTRQMSRLIDMVIEDCKDNGIETRTPNEIAEMLSLWESAR